MYVRYEKKRVALVKSRYGTPPQTGAAENGRDGAGGQPMDTAGMYGAILLHEGAGGYVLVAVAVFTLAVVITVICMRLHERERQNKTRTKR